MLFTVYDSIVSKISMVALSDRPPNLQVVRSRKISPVSVATEMPVAIMEDTRQFYVLPEKITEVARGV